MIPISFLLIENWVAMIPPTTSDDVAIRPQKKALNMWKNPPSVYLQVLTHLPDTSVGMFNDEH